MKIFGEILDALGCRMIVLITVTDLVSLTTYFRLSSVTVHVIETKLSTPFSFRVNLLPGNDWPLTFQL